jgi:hypothetical protein
MLSDDNSRQSGRRFGTASELGSYAESRQATLRGTNGGGGSERDSLLHHDELDGGGTLRRQGLTKLNLGSIKGGRDHIKLTDNYLGKHLKRYDDKAAQAFDEQDTFLEKNINAEETSKSLMKRHSMLKKLSRTLLFLVIVGFLLLLDLIVNKAADVNKEYLIASSATPLRVVLPNCYVYLNNEGSGQGVRVSLRAIELIFTPSVIFSRNRVTHSLAMVDGVTTVTVSHKDQDYACGLTVAWPAGEELGSLQIDCEYCTVIAKSPVRIGEFRLKGKGVHSNFLKLSVRSMYLEAVSGMTELHEVEFGGSSSFNVTNGTVTIQSRKDFRVQLSKANDLYCMSAPVVSSNTITCAPQTLKDDILINLYNLTDYSQCSGGASLCLTGTCTPTVTVTFETLVGSLYANILTTADSNTVSDSNTLAAGSRYFKNISLNPSDSQQLLTLLKNSDPMTALPLILRVDVGNFKGMSTSASKFIITEYPLTSVYDPWTVAGLTLGIFTSNYQEISLFLSPGFCPYRPALNRKQ